MVILMVISFMSLEAQRVPSPSPGSQKTQNWFQRSEIIRTRTLKLEYFGTKYIYFMTTKTEMNFNKFKIPFI